MNYFNEEAKKQIINYLISNKEKIKVKSGKCRYNFRCHNNAVHEAVKKGQNRIAMCMYIDGDYPIIHFLNVGKKGKFTDNTLGNWSTQHDYYLIKYINKDDFFNVTNIFKKFRIDIRKQLSIWINLTSNIDF